MKECKMSLPLESLPFAVAWVLSGDTKALRIEGGELPTQYFTAKSSRISIDKDKGIELFYYIMETI